MMFFVAKDDGSREHFFSVTYAEHNALKAQAAVNRELYRDRLQRQEDSLALLEAAPADKTAPDPETEEPPHGAKDPKLSDATADSVPKAKKLADSLALRKRAITDTVAGVKAKRAAVDTMAKKKPAADTAKRKPAKG